MGETPERTKSTVRGGGLPYKLPFHAMKKKFHSLQKREFVSLHQLSAGAWVLRIAIVSR
jgi:hypothetical protein